MHNYHECTEASGNVLRTLGIRMIIYVNDILIMGEPPTLSNLASSSNLASISSY